MTNEQKTEAPDHIRVEPNYNAFGDPSWGAYLHENVGIEYTRTDLSQAAVGATVRACASEMDMAAHIMSHYGSMTEQQCYQNAAKTIHALEPDAQQALDKLLAAEREAFLEEAVCVADRVFDYDAHANGEDWSNGHIAAASKIRDALQALLPTDEQKE